VPLTFSQSANRSYTTPIVIAIAVLAAGLGVMELLLPRRTAELTIKNSATYASHLVFKADSMMVGRETTEDDIYVLVTLHIEDKLHVPLFIKDVTATLTPAEGEPVTTSAAQKLDVPNLYLTFPGLKAVADQFSAPLLLRETQIDPGKSAEGVLVLHFPGTQATWDQRKSATISIDLYHQPPVVVEIPKR
jgi:hypothetical protein